MARKDASSGSTDVLSSIKPSEDVNDDLATLETVAENLDDILKTERLTKVWKTVRSKMTAPSDSLLAECIDEEEFSAYSKDAATAKALINQLIGLVGQRSDRHNEVVRKQTIRNQLKKIFDLLRPELIIEATFFGIGVVSILAYLYSQFIVPHL